MKPPSNAPGGPRAAPPKNAPRTAPLIPFFNLSAPRASVDKGARLTPFRDRAARVLSLPLDRLQDMCVGKRLLKRFVPPSARGLECSTSQAPRLPKDA